MVVIRDKIHSLNPEVDISHVMDRVEKLLDESVAAEPYVIKESPDAETGGYLNLSQIDFDALRERFETGRKHIEIERLRRRVVAKLEEMIRQNRTRMDYLEEFQRLVNEYNRGATDVDVIFEQLVQFTKKIKDEDRRAIEEQLNEEELAIFDLLMKPRVEISEEEIEQVKELSRDLLDTLRTEYLVLDWRKRQRSRAGVQVAIRDAMTKLPPDYPEDLKREKPELIYRHVFDAYKGAGENVYSSN
jgi:type I restriction enzyme R subunit